MYAQPKGGSSHKRELFYARLWGVARTGQCMICNTGHEAKHNNILGDRRYGAQAKPGELLISACEDD